MATYHHQKSTVHKIRRWKRVHHVLFAVIILAVIAAAIAGVIITSGILRQPSTISQPVNSSYSGKVPVKVASDFFSFKSSEPWKFVAKESTVGSKYVYQSEQGGLTEHQLTIYLDKVPIDLQVTNVVPVKPNQNTLETSAVSPKCSLPKGALFRNPTPQTFQNVSYICLPDSGNFIVAAGTTGGSYAIPMNDGKKTRSIGLLYRELTASPHLNIFTEILNSFSLKPGT